MEDQQLKTIKWTDERGLTNAITYVKNTRVEIDEAGLRKALTAKVFDKFTDKVLNRKRMEAAMESGEIDPVTVAKFVTQKETTPYPRYSLTEPKKDTP